MLLKLTLLDMFLHNSGRIMAFQNRQRNVGIYINYYNKSDEINVLHFFYSVLIYTLYQLAMITPALLNPTIRKPSSANASKLYPAKSVP